MQTFQQMLSDVGIVEEPDIENALAYCAFVTEEYGDIAKRLPNRTLAKAVSIGCLEYFIQTYEHQFSAMHENPVLKEPDYQQSEESFTKILHHNGVDKIADISVAKSFLHDLIDVALGNSEEMLGQDRKAIAIVLATLRKLLSVIKEQP